MSIFSRLFNRETAQTMTQEITVTPGPEEAVKPLKDLRSQMVDPRPKSGPLTYQSKADFIADMRTGAFEAPKPASEPIILPEGVRIGRFYKFDRHTAYKATSWTAKSVGRALNRIDHGLKLDNVQQEHWTGRRVLVYNLYDISNGKAYKVFWTDAIADDKGELHEGWMTLHQVESEGTLKWAVHYSSGKQREEAWKHNQKVEANGNKFFLPVWGHPTIFVYAALLLNGEEITLLCGNQYAKDYASTVVEYRKTPYRNY